LEAAGLDLEEPPVEVEGRTLALEAAADAGMG
jgi:hypothetical protein